MQIAAFYVLHRDFVFFSCINVDRQVFYGILELVDTNKMREMTERDSRKQVKKSAVRAAKWGIE